MLGEYGMGTSLFASEHEKEILIQKLYGETRTLLESLQSVMLQVQSVLNERESIAKVEVKRYIDEVL